MGVVATSVTGANKPPEIDPKADELLKRVSDYLADAQFFSMHAEVWQDALMPSGERIQGSRTVDLQMRRPDRLHSVVQSTRRSHELYYDGKSITLFNRMQNLYGATNAPAPLDKALDFATEHLGMIMPLEDLIVSDPYKSAVKNVISENTSARQPSWAWLVSI